MPDEQAQQQQAVQVVQIEPAELERIIQSAAIGRATGTAAEIIDMTLVPMAVTAVVKLVMIPSIGVTSPLSQLEYRHYYLPQSPKEPEQQS